MIQSTYLSLRARLLLLVAIAVLPALAITIDTGWEERQAAVEKIRETALRTTRLAAFGHEDMINRTRQLLAVLGRFLDTRIGDPAACSAFLAEMHELYPRYANLGAARRDGEVFCTAVPWIRPVNLAREEWFQRARQTNRFVFGECQAASPTGPPLLVFGHPVNDGDGSMRFVVFAWLDFAWLSQVAAEAQLPSGSNLLVVNHEGTILACNPDTGNWTGKTMPDVPIVQTILAQRVEGMTEASGPDRVRRLYAFTRLRGEPGGADEYVSVGIPQPVMLAEVHRVLARNLTLLGAVAMLAVTLAWVGADAFVLRRVKALLRATKRMGEGDLGARTALPYGREEISQLARAFDEMAASLQRHSELRRRGEEQLQRSHAQLRSLAARLQSAREEERTSVAREIHDELGHALTLLKMDLAALDLGEPDKMVSPALIETVQAMSRSIDNTIQLVRRISTRLRPVVLDNFGLKAAIEWEAQQFQARSGLRCSTLLPADEPGLDPDQSTAVFRVFQEVLINVARHAKATKVTIRLAFEADRLVLEVQDNGRGITAEELERPSSLGILGMRERVAPLGGELRIQGAEGKGTTVTVRLPIRNR